MTPEDLRADIPVADEVAYLNTGASGPSPRRVVDAVAEFQAFHEFETPVDQGPYSAATAALDDVKETVGSLLSAPADDIALTTSTTDGINLAAGSIDWQPGDTVVRTDLEHGAGILPWQRLHDTHDIDVEVVESDRGRVDAEDFKGVVDDARLVCLSSISWNYGTRLPVREVADIAHDAGALVLVDAVQSPGQLPIDVDDLGADFLAGAGHKWLLGPWGAGFLYAPESTRNRLRPTRIGPRGVVDMSADWYEYKNEATMFEVSTMPVAVYRGLEVAIETMQAVGFDAILDRIEGLTERLKDGIPDDKLLSPRSFESGLVSFEVDDPERTVERFNEDGIVVRTLPHPDCVRASIHAFNTEADVDALVEAVRGI